MNLDNADLAGTPASTSVDPHVEIGGVLDLDALSSGEIDIGSVLRRKASSTRWTGYYSPKVSGTYDILVQQGGFGGGGYRLFIDDKLVRDCWDLSTALLDSFNLSLNSVPHKIVLEQHSTAGFLMPRLRMGIVAEGTWVNDAAKKIAANADVVVAAVGFNPQSEAENWDRTFALPPGQDELIRAMAAANKRVIVVVTSGGGVDMRRWIDQVPGLIESWYPGQEGGTALAEILFGEANPSGHLPVTFERRWEDNPAHDNYYPEPGSNRINYKEVFSSDIAATSTTTPGRSFHLDLASHTQHSSMQSSR